MSNQRRITQGQDCLLDLWEKVTEIESPSQLIEELELSASRILGTPCQLKMAGQEFSASHFLRVPDAQGETVAHLVLTSPIPTELGECTELLCKMVSWALDRSNLLGAARERRRLLQELRVGRKILEESLPEGSLCFQDWVIGARLRPAQHLGGDLFGYSHTSGRLRFLLADAVGHGLGSTLLASECRALWRGLAYKENLREEVETLSRMICEDTGDSRFVAATLGWCGAQGTIQYAACGQGPCFVVRKDKIEVIEDTNPPLGLFTDQQFEVQQISMGLGDVWVCTTDGVLECLNHAQEMFGEARFVETLRGLHGCPPEKIVESVFAALDRHSVPACPRDDTCILAVRRGCT